MAIGPNVTIMDSDFHNYMGQNDSKEVIIENDVWIGTNATILKGVHIGNGSIVAAGAIVTKDIPSHTLVAGVPAKILKQDITWS